MGSATGAISQLCRNSGVDEVDVDEEHRLDDGLVLLRLVELADQELAIADVGRIDGTVLFASQHDRYVALDYIRRTDGGRIDSDDEFVIDGIYVFTFVEADVFNALNSATGADADGPSAAIGRQRIAAETKTGRLAVREETGCAIPVERDDAAADAEVSVHITIAVEVDVLRVSVGDGQSAQVDETAGCRCRLGGRDSRQ